MRAKFLQFFSDYGMLAALLVLAAFFSWVTWAEQHPTGATAGTRLAEEIQRGSPPGGNVLIVARATDEDRSFTDALQRALTDKGFEVVAVVNGQPADARRALEAENQKGRTLNAIAGNQVSVNWAVFNNLEDRFPNAANAALVQPESYWWPNFLKLDNLLNITNQIAVIGIIAVGMTMVIITAGIDLSVGSLIALAAVVSTWLIVRVGGAYDATVLSMTLCCLGGIIACGGMGLFSGLMITQFSIPPFIVTLGMMLVASGLAFILAQGESIYQVPDSFIWLGRGDDFLAIPNAVVLMFALYLMAYVMMTRMRIGRYIYATGGNITAARLSGLPVKGVLIFVYTLSGLLAGLGGVVMASQLKSGSPTYGLMYELYVIAAVVVGGTSLAGGEGKIFGTLIGAFIIAVIQNGMNLTGVESYTQKVVLGLVILGAVLLDRIKKYGWRFLTK